MALLGRTRAGRRSVVTLAIAAAMVMSMAGAALGVTTTIGNEAIDRANGPDGWNNFTIVDTNNPATFEGYFDEVTFYAGRTGFINFVVVDENLFVTYVSEEFEVMSTGVHTVYLSAPAGVTAGDNLGYYTRLTGVIDYDRGSSVDTLWEPRNSGIPAVDDLFDDIAGGFTNNDRIYSMNATIHATSPDACKKGGWELYSEFKNQGQCIASFVANDNAEPHN